MGVFRGKCIIRHGECYDSINKFISNSTEQKVEWKNTFSKAFKISHFVLTSYQLYHEPSTFWNKFFDVKRWLIMRDNKKYKKLGIFV